MAENSELVSFLERRAVRYYGELTRVDSKCNTLLGLSSAGLALLVVFATGVAPLPVASRLLVALAVLSVVAAILVLLRTTWRPWSCGACGRSVSRRTCSRPRSSSCCRCR